MVYLELRPLFLDAAKVLGTYSKTLQNNIYKYSHRPRMQRLLVVSQILKIEINLHSPSRRLMSQYICLIFRYNMALLININWAIRSKISSHFLLDLYILVFSEAPLIMQRELVPTQPIRHIKHSFFQWLRAQKEINTKMKVLCEPENKLQGALKKQLSTNTKCM